MDGELSLGPSIVPLEALLLRGTLRGPELQSDKEGNKLQCCCTMCHEAYRSVPRGTWSWIIGSLGRLLDNLLVVDELLLVLRGRSNPLSSPRII